MNLANQLTILRIVLVPVFLSALIYYSPQRPWLLTLGIWIFTLACLSDALDGYLARILRQKTVLGSYIDPLADKLLLLSGFLSLSFMSHLPPSIRIPAWVTIPVISRDLIILLGSIVIFIATGRLTAKPLLVGKATTLVQMLTVLTSLLSAPPFLQEAFFIASVLLTVVSGLQYIRMGGRMLQEV